MWKNWMEKDDQSTTQYIVDILIDHAPYPNTIQEPTVSGDLAQGEVNHVPS